MLKYTYFLIAVLLLCVEANAQWRVASLMQNGMITHEECEAAIKRVNDKARSIPTPMEGFPRSFPSDPSFKNFRNVTLHDLDGAPGQEIVVGIGTNLYVISAEDILWSRQLSGIVRFPPSIGEIDGDEGPDISVLTGYNQGPGMAYCMTSNGDLIDGWPRTFDGHTLVSSSTLADLDEDGQMEIIFGDISAGQGSLYVLKGDGLTFSSDWPILLPNVPAVTPSIGDVDADGKMDIVINTTRENYVFDLFGQPNSGWPSGDGLTKYSFQSPLLANLVGDRKLEIVGAGHGDQPQYYIQNAEGQFLPNWPISVPEQSWTFQPPTLISYQDAPLILVGRPIDNRSKDMLYGYRVDGSLAAGFPIVKPGGLEGLITVGDIDGDQAPEMLFSSNLIDASGRGFIHAYELDGSGELPNFPLSIYGWTYLNGVTLGDVNGDDRLDMVILSYTEYLNDEPDTTFVNVFELDVPIHEPSLLWPTYKGSNTHDGMVQLDITTSEVLVSPFRWTVAPNPAWSQLTIESDQPALLSMYDLDGNVMLRTSLSQGVKRHLDIGEIPTGVYVLSLETKSLQTANRKIFIIGD